VAVFTTRHFHQNFTKCYIYTRLEPQTLAYCSNRKLKRKWSVFNAVFTKCHATLITIKIQSLVPLVSIITYAHVLAVCYSLNCKEMLIEIFHNVKCWKELKYLKIIRRNLYFAATLWSKIGKIRIKKAKNIENWQKLKIIILFYIFDVRRKSNKAARWRCSPYSDDISP